MMRKQPPADQDPPRRVISIRGGLLIAFALVVVLVSGALLTASLLGTARLARDVAGSLMFGLERDAEVRLHNQFDPVRRELIEDYAAIRQGRYSTKDPETLRKLLLPVLFSLPQIDSLMVVDQAGGHLLVMRYNETVRQAVFLKPVADRLPAPDPGRLQFLTRDYRPSGQSKTSHFALWDDAGRKLLLEWDLPLVGYDGPQRPWYKAAISAFRDQPSLDPQGGAADLVGWTEVYGLFITKAPGISAAVAARDPSGEILIVTCNVPLEAIARFTMSVQPSPHGMIFVMTEDGKLIGPPRVNKTKDEADTAPPSLQPIAEAGFPGVQAAVAKWQVDQGGRTGRFRLALEGGAWWVGFVPFEIGSRRRLWIGMLLPESDLIPAARQFQWLIAGVGFLALCAAAFLALRLARWFSKPLTELAEQSSRIAALDLAETPPVHSRLAELDLVSGTLGRMRDALRTHIAEREQSRREILESEERYRTLIESSIIGIVVLQDGRVCYANPAALQIGGFQTAQEVLTQNDWAVFAAPAFRDELRSRFQALLGGANLPPHPGWEVLRKDGSRRWVQSNHALVKWAGADAVLCFMRDITDLRDAAHRQQALEEQLREAQKLEAVGLLAGGIAHDFNNLLQAIGGNANLALIPGSEHAEVETALREIVSAVERASLLTRQLLTFGRRQALQRQRIELNGLVTAHLAMLRRLIPENIRIEFQPAPQPVVVEADKGQLEQVLLNLCLNARDAMAAGGRLSITIEPVVLDAPTAEQLCQRPGGPFARIKVSDTGEGMTPAVLGRIFEPFFSTKPHDKSYGLGLAVVYGIVRQHGGHIDARSEPGRGTEFVVLLPCDPCEQAPAEAPRAGLAPEAAGPVAATILLAEDNEAVRRLAERVLGRLGARVISAVDGPEAVERFVADPGQIDLLFLDVMLPGLSGFEVAARCRSHRPDIPVLFASGYAADSVDARGEIAAGDPILRKPYSVEDLRTAVRALVGVSGNRRGAARTANP
jgi:two-component system, cell cycle sensor histidine kinase and response regulator CckA